MMAELITKEIVSSTSLGMFGGGPAGFGPAQKRDQSERGAVWFHSTERDAVWFHSTWNGKQISLAQTDSVQPKVPMENPNSSITQGPRG